MCFAGPEYTPDPAVRVPLAREIIELRDSMLFRDAIITRELGITCVNGIAGIVDLLRNSDLVAVDCYLGVVTVGAPEFDLEQVTLDLYSQSAEIPYEKTKE